MQHHKGSSDEGMAHDADGLPGELSYAMAASRRTEFRKVSRLVKACFNHADKLNSSDVMHMKYGFSIPIHIVYNTEHRHD